MKALKDVYSEVFILRFAALVNEVYPAFHTADFQGLVFDEKWDERTLKERMRHITVCLRQTLPSAYREALNILLQVASKIPDEELACLFLPDFVEVYGLDDWEASLPALEVFTQYTSSEFAVRPFIMQDQERMMAQMLKWTTHCHARVRRLASEGCRPRLPWGMSLPAFKDHPLPILPILTNLKRDDSLYVRKSVANNLNDIAKSHPDLVFEIAKDWYGEHPHTDWIVKHGCRTLMKQGNKQVLSLFGFNDAASVSVEEFILAAAAIQIGDNLQFSFQLTTESDDPHIVRVEYAIDFVKAKGDRSKKKFKIAENTIKKGKVLAYDRTHAFKDLTTRKHYAGLHTLSIFINGEEKARQDFLLEQAANGECSVREG